MQLTAHHITQTEKGMEILHCLRSGLLHSGGGRPYKWSSVIWGEKYKLIYYLGLGS